ncbi:hypothetical protein CAPTEDRAFT_196019 [Capitella teleta]|uniref:TNFR-Cys domain-containing protein n=1 Tax=Capitella teleta TaxID=283909 RepID=R7VJF5_CAPTE|nr:hypothetical protein CAPTEDRAFT_196019 [Capitella teleta]|eukprot:ELU15910.1 hypothetical protein CAPTEDRAFT_196019 [Capitella teleta]
MKCLLLLVLVFALPYVISECCVHDCNDCPERTVVVSNGFDYCCSDCQNGGAVTVDYAGCLCDRSRQLSLLAGIPSDSEACINSASLTTTSNTAFFVTMVTSFGLFWIRL